MIHPKTRKEREVWLALNSLTQNQHPDYITGEMIGNRLIELGFNRGSNSDISRYRKTWLQAQQSQQETPTDHPPFPMLSDPIAQAAQALKSSLIAESRDEIAKIQKIAETQIQAAEEAAQQSKQEALQSEKEAQKAQAILMDLRDRELQLEKKLTEITTNWHRDQERLAAITTEKEAITQQCSELIALQQNAREDYETLKKEHQSLLNTLIEKQESQRHYWINEHDQLKTNLKKLTESDLEKESLLNSVKAELNITKKELESAQQKIAETNSLISSLEAFQDLLKEQTASAQKQFHHLEKSILQELENLKSPILKTPSAIHALENQIKTMSTQLDPAILKSLLESLDNIQAKLNQAGITK